MKAVVTGGCGFVGRHLVDALVARGDEVTVLDVAREVPRDDVRYVRGSVTDADEVRAACRGADLVFHNASMVHTRQSHAALVWDVNLGGARNVLRACREEGVPRLVYVSSASAVYEGRDIENGDESLPYASVSQAPYADSKIAAEKEVLAASEPGGLGTCAIRPHVIFGPGDNRFVPALVKRARAGTLKVAVGRGRHKLSDFTYVDNLVDALLRAGDALGPGGPARGRAYFVTNGEPMGFWDFVDAFLAELGEPPVRASLPYPVAYGLAAVVEAARGLRGGDPAPEDGFTRFAIRYMCTHHYFDIARARRDLGYEPRIAIAEGIRRTVAAL